MVNPNKIKMLPDDNEFNLVFINRSKSRKYDFKNLLKDLDEKLYEKFTNRYDNVLLKDKYDYYKFIRVDEENVGFALYSRNHNNHYPEDLILEYFFAIDEYLYKFNFFNEVLCYGMLDIAIRNPTRNEIDLLINDGIPEQFNKRFLEMHASLLCDKVSIDDTLNKTINSNDEINIKDKDKCKYYSSFYDLELCSVAVDSMEVRKDNIKSVLSYCFTEDDEKYNCLEKRRNDSWIKDDIYCNSILDIKNIWTAETNNFNGYDYFIDEDDPVRTEEYYTSGEYKNSEIYKELFEGF